MRRRTLLAAVGTGLTTPGCVGLAPASNEHPFAGETQTVAVRTDSTSPHDLAALAEAALSFWEANGEQYAGFPVAFEVGTEDPDMVLAFRDSPAGCENVPNYSDQVLGCAPVLSAGSVPRRPVVARVVAGARPPGAICVTTQHEIGHTLGLNHDDPPANVMSNRPEDRIPEYARRLDIWERVQAIHDRATEAVSVLNYGIELYNDGEDDAAALALETVAAGVRGLVTDLTTTGPDIDALEANVDVETVAVEGLATALAASARGSGRQRETDLDMAIEYAETFNSIEVIQLRDVAVALGLVRAFDNEEPVIEQPETP